jgi:hypothetical protein
MKATELFRTKAAYDVCFIEIVIWRVPEPVRQSSTVDG